MSLLFLQQDYKSDQHLYHQVVHQPHPKHKLEQGLIRRQQIKEIKQLRLVHHQIIGLNFEVLSNAVNSLEKEHSFIENDNLLINSSPHTG